jgi:hypothetical protein
MGKRGWLVGVCAVGSAWLGCAGEAMPSSPNDGFSVAAPAGASAPGFPQAGTTAVGGAAGMAGVAGTAASGATPDASAQPTPDAGAAPDATTPPQPDAGQPAAGEWSLLMEESWNLPAGGEDPQWCGDLMLTEDIFVAAIRPVHPLGTHHTTLSVTNTATECTSAALLGDGIIYAAGVGSEVLRMPAGVAMKLSAGRVLRLGLHLYNPTDQPLAGVSGVEVIRVAAADVEHEAELMLTGPLRLMIEPGRQTVMHTCNVTEPQTVFALFPHMHQLGVHLKTTVTTGGQSRVIHDGEYAFEEQTQIALDPFPLAVGDRITTECTFENMTGRTVGFGESSDTEMCFSILFRYPATGSSFCGR